MIHDLNHRGAVLSVAMSSTGEQCFSGGVDGTIQCWNTPNPNIDPYDSYGNSLVGFAVIWGFSNQIMMNWVLLYYFSHRPVCAARSPERTHRLCLGFGVQQRTPAPPLLLRGWDGETVGRQHHLTRPRSIQRKQKYWLYSSCLSSFF